MCGEGAAWLLICAYVWILNRRVSIAVKDWALLPQSFGVPAENCFEYSIASVNDAVDVSGKTVDFCISHGEDKTKSVMIGLCIEEITCNTVIHGFSKGTVHYYELHRSKDPVAHLGIRTVVSYAREAVYLNTLGLNNLILTL